MVTNAVPVLLSDGEFQVPDHWPTNAGGAVLGVPPPPPPPQPAAANTNRGRNKINLRENITANIVRVILSSAKQIFNNCFVNSDLVSCFQIPNATYNRS